jgi:hypothetical protein
MRKWFIIIAYFLVSLPLYGQVDSLRMGYSVQGNVVDAATGRPLESVHVSIPGRQQATVTNSDGFFILKSNQPISVVECSYLGYRTQQKKADGTLRVALQRENLQLQEATIISGDARSIVEAAVDCIGENYCTQPQLLEVFYRETLKKRNRYTYVAEAVARLYKSAFNSFIYNDAAALEKSRVLVSQRRTDTLSVKTQGGPTMAIGMDLVKNTQVLFNKEDLALYGYEMLQPAYIDGRLQFVIRMYPNALVDFALYNCVVYIDRELLSFTRVEASLDMSDKNKATRMMLVSKPFTLRFFPQECSVVLNYRLENGKTRLEYFRSTMRFACDWRKRLFRTHYTAVNELVVTDVRPEATPIRRQERFRFNDFLPDKAPQFYDPDFWADYNIIEPSESLEHAIRRLRK